MLGQEPKLTYTRANVRRMLQIREGQLQSWQRLGFIGDQEEFSFQDLIALRTLKNLRRARVPVPVITKAIEAVKKRVEGVLKPLSELRIVSNGRKVSVLLAGETLEPISGQLLLDFDAIPQTPVRPLEARTRTPKRSKERESEAYFEKGLQLEESGAPISEAMKAYQTAIELNPRAVGALVNLGTLCFHSNRLAEAEKHYQAAIDADPSYSLARFNLGNLFDERGAWQKAAEQYEYALKLNPNYSDAHYNLALVRERLGDPMRAARHWKAYLRLDSGSSWAEIARRQLDRLRAATLVKQS